MDDFKIKLINSYDDILLDIYVYVQSTSKDEVEYMARNIYKQVFMHKDRIELLTSDGELLIIQSKEKERYRFQIAVKEMEQILSSNLLELDQEEIISLFKSPKFIKGEDDYSYVDWTIEEGYALLKKITPGKEVYPFESLAYGFGRMSE